MIVRLITGNRYLPVAALVLCLWLPGTARAQTGADECAEAEATAGVGTFGFDNAVATQDGPGHAACAEFGQPDIDRDVWFCWLSDCDGEVTIETCGQTGVDTTIAVYDGCACPPSDSNLLGCDDDDCGFQSSLGFVAVSGGSYLIRLGSSPSASGGTGMFTISCAPLDNDSCAGADPIWGLGPFAFDNASANSDGPSHPGCLEFDQGQIDHDVWFDLAWNWTSEVTIETCGQTGVDTRIAVYDGAGCPPSDANLLACSDDACGLQSKLTFDGLLGKNYLIRIGTFPGASGGPGTFTLTTEPPMPTIPPAPLPEPSGVVKNRVISFAAPDSTVAAVSETAIRVTLRRMYIGQNEDADNGCPVRTDDPDLSTFENQTRWLGPPGELSENTVPAMPNFIASQLQCCPHFRDWSEAALAAEFGGDNGLEGDADVSVMHAFGAEIVPCSTYELQAVDVSCPDLSNDGCFSPALTIDTAKWGDVWEPFDGASQPNFTDIGKVVDKFKGIPYDPGPPESGAPPKVRAMLRENITPLGLKISFTDIGRVVDAWKTIAYPEDGPTACPACP